MLYSFFATDDTEDKTGVDWLDVAITLANILFVQLLVEIEQQVNNRRLTELGNVAVLKTDERESVQGFESSTFGHEA